MDGDLMAVRTEWSINMLFSLWFLDSWCPIVFFRDLIRIVAVTVVGLITLFVPIGTRNKSMGQRFKSTTTYISVEFCNSVFLAKNKLMESNVSAEFLMNAINSILKSTGMIAQTLLFRFALSPAILLLLSRLLS